MQSSTNQSKQSTRDHNTAPAVNKSVVAMLSSQMIYTSPHNLKQDDVSQCEFI